ncbi:MAG: hypothetical protein V1774_08215 [Candidatus Eisenbacteria bacterium]
MISEQPVSSMAQTARDLAFVRRTLITSAWLGALVALVLWAYLGWRWGLGLVGGVFLGALNLAFLTALIPEIVRPGQRKLGKIAALLALKIPFVYGGLAVLLVTKAVPAAAVIVGFSLILVVIVLKAGGRALLQSGIFTFQEKRTP